jgi:hypothetical protein
MSNKVGFDLEGQFGTIFILDLKGLLETFTGEQYIWRSMSTLPFINELAHPYIVFSMQ